MAIDIKKIWTDVEDGKIDSTTVSEYKTPSEMPFDTQIIDFWRVFGKIYNLKAYSINVGAN